MKGNAHNKALNWQDRVRLTRHMLRPENVPHADRRCYFTPAKRVKLSKSTCQGCTRRIPGYTRHLKIN
eukprot:Skav230217  [mRNA]  locus=scaffold1558:5852:7478:- [translate_table: standard]